MLRKNRKKKTPNDYPLFAIRMSDKKTKKEIDGLLKDALKAYNKRIEEDEALYKKNEIATEALRIGLNELIRRKS